MPTLIQPEDMKIAQQGEGWRAVALAETSVAGMVARRWLLDPEVRTPEITHGDVDQLLYVIRGSGQAVVGATSLPLDRESMLWLEPGDCCYFVAGDAGLEILQGHSPDRET